MLETVGVNQLVTRPIYLKEIKENSMWTKPTYETVRLGFEITMYVKQK